MTALTRVMDAVLAVGFAGLLWVLASFPIVTLGPATAGVCSVMNEWDEHGPPPVWSTYWGGFRRHLRQSLWLGFLATVVGTFLSIDLLYGLRAEDAPLRAVVLGAAVLGILALGGTLVFAFPVMVRYPAPWRRVVRNSALFAAAYPLSTLLCIGSVALGALAVTVVPALLPVVAGVCGWLVTRLARRVFDRFLARQQARAEAVAPGQHAGTHAPSGEG
ncbi:DUF624 domain-containing protein [Actinopolymorpha sp. B9G3]|uniref:YesL family protein n=1 Tax=Actinopolymorpha sp. B9G3 TaxID=3158970 RepID=UPI0032D95343